MLINNLNKIHTTSMGIDRIRKNLNLDLLIDVVDWCKNAITNADLCMQLNKNWYVYYKGTVITVNATSYTIITAHKLKCTIREIEKDEY